jgi:hypothetical protein
MKALMVILGFALLGCLLMGMLMGWSVKFCVMGGIAGSLWAIPYGILILNGSKASG